jgi:hypothetical protein
MRKRLLGLIAGIAMFTAMTSLAASPVYAATYFFKYVYSTSSNSSGCSGPALNTSVKHGNVVYKRTATTMSATASLKGADPFHNYGFLLVAANSTNTRCGSHLTPNSQKGPYTTDNHGDTISVFLGPAPFSGNPDGGSGSVTVTSFWVFITDFGSSSFTTARVPTHGT